jgi:hypothetical protein
MWKEEPNWKIRNGSTKIHITKILCEDKNRVSVVSTGPRRIFCESRNDPSDGINQRTIISP